MAFSNNLTLGSGFWTLRKCWTLDRDLFSKQTKLLTQKVHLVLKVQSPAFSSQGVQAQGLVIQNAMIWPWVFIPSGTERQYVDRTDHNIASSDLTIIKVTLVDF